MDIARVVSRAVRLVLHCSPGALGAVLVLACTGTTTVQADAVYGYAVAEPAQVPPQIYYQPRVYYRGQYAYLMDGRWYYPQRGRWVVFRDEPTELRRYRVYEVDRYEPARPYRAPTYRPYPRGPEYSAPPAPRRYYAPR
jgi:hypothetical protein